MQVSKSALKSIASTMLALSGMVFLHGAQAAEVGASFEVSADVQSSCTIRATGLAFGTFNPRGATAESTSTVTASCTNGTPFSIGLDAGTTAGATTSNRLMTSTGIADQLRYALFLDAGRTTNWDNLVSLGGTNVITGTGTGADQDFSVFGRVESGQTVAPAVYADTVTATIQF